MARTSKKDVEAKVSKTDTVDEKEVTVEQKPQKPKTQKIRDLHNSIQLSVKSNIKADLYFQNDRTGTVVTWREKDEIQYLSVEDIKHMKAAQTRFLSDNWITIVGVADEEYEDLTIEEIYKALSIQNYYKATQITNEFEDVLFGSKAELSVFIQKLTGKEKDLFRAFITSLDESKKESLSYGNITLLTNELGINFDEE